MYPDRYRATGEQNGATANRRATRGHLTKRRNRTLRRLAASGAEELLNDLNQDLLVSEEEPEEEEEPDEEEVAVATPNKKRRSAKKKRPA